MRTGCFAGLAADVAKSWQAFQNVSKFPAVEYRSIQWRPRLHGALQRQQCRLQAGRAQNQL